MRPEGPNEAQTGHKETPTRPPRAPNKREAPQQTTRDDLRSPNPKRCQRGFDDAQKKRTEAPKRPKAWVGRCSQVGRPNPAEIRPTSGRIQAETQVPVHLFDDCCTHHSSKTRTLRSINLFKPPVLHPRMRLGVSDLVRIRGMPESNEVAAPALGRCSSVARARCAPEVFELCASRPELAPGLRPATSPA